MTHSFKVTIPNGSLLEHELSSKKGKQRQQRLYFLAELGAETLRRENIQTPNEIIEKKVKNGDNTNNNKGRVSFPVNDLLSM